MEGMEADGIVGLIHTNKKNVKWAQYESWILVYINMDIKSIHLLRNLYCKYTNITVYNYEKCLNRCVVRFYKHTHKRNWFMRQSCLWDTNFGLGSLKVRENDKSLN